MSNCCGSSRNADASTSGLAASSDLPAASHGARVHCISVNGGRTFIGTDTPEIVEDGEGPARVVALSDFGLEAQTVTVQRFAEFVDATGYVTEAERYGWSSVFFGDQGHLSAARQVGSALPWWHRIDGATWRQPEGPGSSIDTRLDHPVTQVSWADANMFASWVGGRLPTEAEWEHAARGGARSRRFPWGEAEPDDQTLLANIWQGQFPTYNTGLDGFERTAPARSFAPNDLGFYNLAGNVWEWTHDAFRIRSNSKRAKTRNEQARLHAEKVLKGGSFLCHKSYCYRYRIAARMALSPDSAASNVGFRVAYDN